MRERQQIMLWQITQQANKNDYRRLVGRFSQEILKLFRLFITHTQTLFCIHCNWAFACHAAAAIKTAYIYRNSTLP